MVDLLNTSSCLGLNKRFSRVFQIHTIAIIAEGIPEALTRKIIKKADEQGVTIIGPATVCLHILFYCI